MNSWRILICWPPLLAYFANGNESDKKDEKDEKLCSHIPLEPSTPGLCVKGLAKVCKLKPICYIFNVHHRSPFMMIEMIEL